jgi:hypothetical protein
MKTKQITYLRFVTLPDRKAGYMSRLTGAYPSFEEGEKTWIGRPDGTPRNRRTFRHVL